MTMSKRDEVLAKMAALGFDEEDRAASPTTSSTPRRAAGTGTA